MKPESTMIAEVCAGDAPAREAIQTLASMLTQTQKDLALQAEINQALLKRIFTLEENLQKACAAIRDVAEPLGEHLRNHPSQAFLHPAAECRMWRSVREQFLALHERTGLLQPPSPSIPQSPPAPILLKSRLCSQTQFEEPWYGYWCSEFKDSPAWQRKQWEWCYIAQALHERGFLKPGSKGLGFGVGEEPLTGAFAARGCAVLATDLDGSDTRSRVWAATHQHAGALAGLNARGICDQEQFAKLVAYRPADMNAIPPEFRNFDFVWSSCSLDHVGTLDKASQFILNSLDCLRPGGLAVHTTEFNISSNHQTITEGETVVFRQADIERLAQTLRRQGHHMELDWTLGNGLADNCVDVFPYDNKVLLRLQLHQYVITSIGLIITKAGSAA